MAAVTMLHPPSERVQQASRDAFERVWQHQGWVLVEDEPAPAESPYVSEQPVDPSQPGPRDNKAAWVEWAVGNGADRAEADAMTKKDLIAAFG